MKFVNIAVFIPLLFLCFFNCVTFSSRSNHSLDLHKPRESEPLSVYIRSATSAVKDRGKNHFYNYDAAFVEIIRASCQDFPQIRFIPNVADADYSVELVLNQYGQRGNMLFPLLSLFIIPAKEVVQDLLFVYLYDKDGYLLKKYQFSEVTNEWTGWLFLPIGWRLPSAEDGWDKLLLYAFDTVYNDIIDGNPEVAAQ